MNYEQFIASKQRRPNDYGIEVERSQLNKNLFPWQAAIVQWALKRGRAALFEDCGLGKTLQQLEWASVIHRETGENVLIHCPIGVRPQTLREAEKFGIDGVYICNDDSDVRPGIALTNYEKLHKIEPARFAAVVLDESSILKSYTGTTKQALISKWGHAKYRLACTATPAPNDHMELGNHAEFLGVMPSNEMLSRWFINDTMRAGGYRLKRHAESDFWQWMATWAVSLEKPSDIGGDDSGFVLPPLIRRDHVVDEPEGMPAEGMLFASYELSATNVHRQKRLTTACRAAKVGELVSQEPDIPWLLWCDTNYEADALLAAIPDLVDIRGCHSDSKKETVLQAFSRGECLRLVTKPTIAGFGMNWQHCRRVAFIGLSYSYEQYYQAVRRCWRFGQTEPVHVHVVMSEGECAICQTVEMKERAHSTLKHSMAAAMKRFSEHEICGELIREKYEPSIPMEMPKWKSQFAC